MEVVDSDWLDIKLKVEFTDLVIEEKFFLEQEARGYSVRSVSGLLQNKFKNRYTGYRPLDSTRVVLSELPGIEGSDYINASYISGELPETYHYYIACQAPLESTTSDFWRMIWEQKCGVIVMVTDVEEDKATQYWPEEGEVARYGQYLVCQKKNFQMGDIQVRSLLVKEDSFGNEDTREIIHLQYRDWPDFGVPQTTKPLKELLSLSSKFKQRAAAVYNLVGPMVVHCSAGVGRTGVFIAAHITLEKLKNNLPVNIQETVRRLRSQRQGMIRTQEQYSLVYSIMFDVLSHRKPSTSGKCLVSSGEMNVEEGAESE
jgi:protein tyrosine phosphatase